MRIQNKKRIICVLLTLGLLATGTAGCGQKKEDSGKETAGVKVENGELTPDSVVMTVGSETITYQQMKVYTYILQSMYKDTYGKKLWDYPISDEGTLGDYAREELVNLVTQIKIIGLQAAEEDIILDNDEKTEISGNAQTLFSDISSKNIEKYGLTLENLEKVLQENALANKMFYLSTAEVDTVVSDEDAAQVKIQFIEVITNGTNRNGKEIQMSEKEKDSAYKRIKRMKKQAMAADSFFTFANENSDRGEAEVTLGRDSEEFEQIFIQQAFSLKTGEFSKILEGEEGFYLLYCVSDYDEEATQAKKEEIIAAEENELFKEKYASWLDKYEVNISNSYWEEEDYGGL